MHAIEISGERYIKATDAAGITGYATDYIGQLSRSGKIAAERVGRVWYVKESDIVGHKKGATRSNKRKTQESLKHEIEGTAGQIHHAFYQPNHDYAPEFRKRLLNAEVRYEGDAHPLAPAPRRAGEAAVRREALDEPDVTEPLQAEDADLPVELPVERMLEIASEEEEELPPRTPIPHARREPRMKGTVALTEVAVDEEEEVDIPEPEPNGTITVTPLHPKKKSLVAYGRPSYALMLPVARFLMPLLIVVAFCASLSGVFLEQVLVYERGKTLVSRPYYEMSYGVRAVSAVKEAISWQAEFFSR